MGLAKNFAYKTTLNFFSIILPVLIMPYVFRVLNPESVGLYEYSLSIVSYFSAFGLFGFYLYGLRVISINRDNPHVVSKLYNDLFFLGILTNLIALVSFLCYVLIAVGSPSLRYIMLIFSFNIIANIFYIEWINEAFEKYKFISIKTIIVRLISIALILLLVRKPDDIYLYAIITVTSLILNNAASFIYSSKYLKLDLKAVRIKEHLIPLFMIFVLNNSFLLYGNCDKVVLGANVGKESVAYYSVAQKAISVIYTLLMGLTAVSYPRLAYLLNQDYRLYKSTLKNIISNTMFALIPASIGLALLSKEAILLLAGNQYVLSIPSLQVGSIYLIITAFVSIMNNHVMLVQNKEKICALLFLIFGIANTLIDVLLAKRLTPSIAFATTALAELLLFVTMLIYAKRHFDLFSEILNKQTLKYLVISLAFIPIILIERKLFGYSIIVILGVSIVSCSAFYFLLLYFTKDQVLLSLIQRYRNKA